MLNNGIDEMGVIGLGILPQFYNKVFKTHDYVIEGSMLSIEKDMAVVGAKIVRINEFEFE